MSIRGIGSDVIIRGLRSGAAAFLILWTGCASSGGNGPSVPPQAGAVPVDAAEASLQTVPVELQAVGTVQAYSTVEVTSQVSGQLESANFQEGQRVREGALLFEIDPRPFRAALDQARAELSRQSALLNQARADLAKDQTQAATAKVEAQRYASLLDRGVVTKEQYDQYRTNAQALEASVKADQAAIRSAQESVKAQQAAVESAQLQLGYASIYAPVTGLTGALLVQPGNIVKANSTVLVVINQLQPIYVEFSVPEKQLDEIRSYMAKGRPKVTASPTGGSETPSVGELTFMDNAADSATGTIGLKATFSNKGDQLWPGQFVNVVLTLAEQSNALVVPSQAVQTGQSGEYVYVIQPDLTVQQRPVTAGRSIGSRTVINQGLQVGEKVVTDGQLRLSPGAKVEIRTHPSPSGDQGSMP